MFKKSLISVILPIYNVERWLPRCLDSIQRNTYTNLEIICVLDGSPDHSAEIVKKYAAEDPRYKFYSKQNGGCASARNFGLEHANGEYIAFIDPDDWISASYFENLYKAIENNKADVAICNYNKSFNGENHFTFRPVSICSMTVAEMFADYDLKTFVWGKLYRHETVASIRFDEHMSIDDTTYNYDVYIHAPQMKINYIACSMYAYYIRQGSITSKPQYPGLLPLAKRLLNQAEQCADDAVKSILAEEACKRALAAGFSYAALNDKENLATCRQYERCALKMIKKHRFRYTALVLCPVLYGIWRIVKDPTMLDYAKRLKQHDLEK